MRAHPVVLVLVALGACGGAQGAGEAEEAIDPTRLYPLQEGNVWTYDVDTGVGLSALGISRVVEVQGSRVTVENNGSSQDAIVYEIRPEGIYRVASETWLLRRPIEVGASWPGAGGRQARITAVDETVEVGAGTFEDCVSVVEDDGRQAVTTVYCPDVGPVVVDTRIQTELSGQNVVVRGELRAHMLGEDRASVAQKPGS